MEKDQLSFNFADTIQFSIGWKSLIGIGVVLVGIAMLVYACRHG